MPIGYSPKFPLSISDAGGFSLNEDFKDLVKQNFKTLLLTIPGEKIMLPDFGVGLQKLLFENKEKILISDIESVVKQQVAKYMPYITILTTYFSDNSGIDSDNLLNLKIIYFIKPTLEKDDIEIII